MIRIVIDTNIFLGAVLQPEKTCRRLLRHVMEGKYQSLDDFRIITPEKFLKEHTK